MTTKDTLEKSQALENKIRALGGQMTPQQQKQLLQEMLEIRVSELTNEGLSRKTAIEKTCKEFEMDFQEKNTDKEQEQFKLLEETKQEMLNHVAEVELTPAEEEARKKKLEEQEKQQEQGEKDKGEVNAPRWITGSSLSYLAGGLFERYQATTLTDALRDAPQDATIYMHVNTHNVTFGWREGPPKEFGKNDNATTLDYDGLKLTSYDYGMHGEARLEIASNATEEQKARFLEAANKATKEINEQKDRGYSLLDDNCQKARTTLGNAVDPTMKQCSMPWNANAEFEKKYEQQKADRPAPADGTKTDCFGKTPEPVPRPEPTAAQKPAPTPS